MSATDTPTSDPRDVRFASSPHPRLEPFNRAGVLGPAEVHTAQTLGRLVGESDPDVFLAAALAVRAPQQSHVCIELANVQHTAIGDDGAEIGIDELEWPDPDTWRERIAGSPLVAVRPPGSSRPDPADDRPFSLVGDRLYLDRYWRYERRVAEVIRRRAGRVRDDLDAAAVRRHLDRVLPPGDERPDRQRLAIAASLLRALTVIAGGPGTGKTFTIARLLAMVHALAGDRVPRVAVAAPTGKAADRLTVALRNAAAELDVSDEVRRRLRRVEASTIHRLLGWTPNPTRFVHHARHQLPHELVVVDETSMVDLPLMSKLLSALRRPATLVLVGDPDQLASVEAGTVLADVVGPTDGRLRLSAATRRLLTAATGEPLDDVTDARPDGIDDAVVTLGAARRYDEASGIGALAAVVHAGDPDGAVEVLGGGHPDLGWISDPVLPTRPSDDPPGLAAIRHGLASMHADVHRAANEGDGTAALAALDRMRVLCAHRRGPAGVRTWVPLIERWLGVDVDRYDPATRWYPGRPLLVTQNIQRLRLHNGDVGVVVRRGDGVAAAFTGPDGIRTFGPSRLEHVESVHAMTIHKSQGSEFDAVVVVLPQEDSPILTRELLYTAVTRARRHVTVVGSPAVVRSAVARPITRAAGLREALWGG